MNKKKMILLPLVSLGLVLASCGDNPVASSSGQTSGGESTSQGGASSNAGTYDPGDVVLPESPTGNLANGTYDFTQLNWKERSKILASLEYYALRNHSAGIPLYDDATYEQFSQRITLPSQKYLTNYGFGTSYGRIDGSGKMYNATINEPNAKWQSYFHGYTNTDSGTFNGWNATGSDVTERTSMITSSYFGVKANEDNTAYSWVGSLSQTDAPIMLDENGKVISADKDGYAVREDGSFYTKLGEDGVTEQKVLYSEATSQRWRVKVKTGSELIYHTAETSRWKSKYDGTNVKLEDYLTPFKALLMSNMARTSELVSDTSGFQGAMDFFYNNNKAQYLDNWEASNVGIQLNKEEGAIEFAFIQPKSSSYARTALSSSLFSPIPEDFLKDLGSGSFTTGTANYGKIGTSKNGSYTDVFDNILTLGAYIPEYWQQNSKLVYKANKDYFEASDFHFDGYTEVIFEGTSADENAYNAFLNNELDEVTIPLSQLQAHKNDPTVLRTEGSTIIKLNLNSTTDEEWEYYFGEKGVISTHPANNYWNTQPIMSNDDFLDGVYFAIDRKQLADMAGKNPAVSYLSSAYMLDPNGVVSYRDSAEGKGVVANFQKAAGNEYCYSRSLAETYFKRAGDTLIANGDYERGDEIELKVIYRYQKTIDNLGSYIKSYIEDAFNSANKGNGLTLKLDLMTGGTQYTDTYTKMDRGEFDMAEGAVSGNVLNPLDFMNTLSTNKSLNQGFCLSWGKRTDELHEAGSTDRYAATYNGVDFSYDALWNATQSFTPVDEGLATPVGNNAAIAYNAANKSVDFKAEFSPQVVDDNGNCLYEFSIPDGVAIITSNQQGGFDAGYYTQKYGSLKTNLNGEISFSIPTSEIESIAKRVASQLGTTQRYFRVYFTLMYKIKLNSGTVSKSVLIDLSGKLSDFGLSDANA